MNCCETELIFKIIQYSVCFCRPRLPSLQGFKNQIDFGGNKCYDRSAHVKHLASLETSLGFMVENLMKVEVQILLSPQTNGGYAAPLLSIKLSCTCRDFGEKRVNQPESYGKWYPGGPLFYPRTTCAAEKMSRRQDRLWVKLMQDKKASGSAFDLNLECKLPANCKDCVYSLHISLCSSFGKLASLRVKLSVTDIHQRVMILDSNPLFPQALPCRLSPPQLTPSASPFRRCFFL